MGLWQHLINDTYICTLTQQFCFQGSTQLILWWEYKMPSVQAIYCILLYKAKDQKLTWSDIHKRVWNKAQGIQAPGHYLDEGEVEWVTSSGCTLYLVLLKRRVQNGYYILLFLCKHICLFSLRKSRRISQKLLKFNFRVRGREVRFFLFYILICNHANVLQHQKIDKSHLSKLRTKANCIK